MWQWLVSFSEDAPLKKSGGIRDVQYCVTENDRYNIHTVLDRIIFISIGPKICRMYEEIYLRLQP